MESQPLESIKISELVEKAQIGRATFYRNFDTLEDVLHWRCDLVVAELFSYLAEYAHLHQPMGQPLLLWRFGHDFFLLPLPTRFLPFLPSAARHYVA